MKSTIYFVHYSAKPGGIEVLLPTIINEMKEQRIKVFVIRPLVDVNLSVYKDVHVEVTYGSSNNFLALVKFLFFVLKDRNGIFQLFNTGPFFLIVLKLLRVKRVIYSIHGTIYWTTNLQKFVRRIIWRLGISRSVFFTSNSEHSGNVFAENVSKNTKPVLLYNPIDLNRFCLKVPFNRPEFKIIYVGRLVKSKNLDKWINVSSYLIKNGISAKFELYGEGPDKEKLQKQINDAGLNNAIRIQGYAERVEDVYKSADLLLFLSAYESFGNVVVESILCGTPVITFSIPSMKEIFKEYPEFLIEDDENFEENILNKIKDIQELKKTSIKASANFSERFGASVHVNKLRSIYASLA